MTQVIGISIFGIIWILLGLIIKVKPQWMLGYNKENQPTRGVLNRVAVAFMVSGFLMILLFCCSYFILDSNLMMSFSLFLPFFISLLYVVRKLKPKKYKTVIAILTGSFILVIAMSIYSMKETSVQVDDNSLKILGFYGETIPLNDIKSISLSDTMPEIGMKVNGFALGSVKKGYFNIKGAGVGKLYLISDKGPFIRIDAKDKSLIINSNESAKTVALYDALFYSVGK